MIDVESWGADRFAKYVQLNQAVLNFEGNVKLLLSYDPSHWDATGKNGQTDIDVISVGSYVGMQLGVEVVLDANGSTSNGQTFTKRSTKSVCE